MLARAHVVPSVAEALDLPLADFLEHIVYYLHDCHVQAQAARR